MFEFGGARDALFAGSIEQQAFDRTDVFFGVYVDYFEFGRIFLPGEDGCTERHLLREIDGACPGKSIPKTFENTEAERNPCTMGRRTGFWLRIPDRGGSGFCRP